MVQFGVSDGSLRSWDLGGEPLTILCFDIDLGKVISESISLVKVAECREVI